MLLARAHQPDAYYEAEDQTDQHRYEGGHYRHWQTPCIELDEYYFLSELYNLFPARLVSMYVIIVSMRFFMRYFDLKPVKLNAFAFLFTLKRERVR